MSDKIKWNLNVEVLGGPKISASQTEIVDAYDKIEVEVPATSDGSTPGEVTIEVQPGDLEDVKFMLIRSDQYSSKLTYTVKNSGGTDGATDVELDSLQLLVGKGAVSLLKEPPATLVFSNLIGVNKVANVSILVGRMAT